MGHVSLRASLLEPGAEDLHRFGDARMLARLGKRLALRCSRASESWRRHRDRGLWPRAESSSKVTRVCVPKCSPAARVSSAMLSLLDAWPAKHAALRQPSDDFARPTLSGAACSRNAASSGRDFAHAVDDLAPGHPVDRRARRPPARARRRDRREARRRLRRGRGGGLRRRCRRAARGGAALRRGAALRWVRGPPPCDSAWSAFRTRRAERRVGAAAEPGERTCGSAWPGAVPAATQTPFERRRAARPRSSIGNKRRPAREAHQQHLERGARLTALDDVVESLRETLVQAHEIVGVAARGELVTSAPPRLGQVEQLVGSLDKPWRPPGRAATRADRARRGRCRSPVRELADDAEAARGVAADERAGDVVQDLAAGHAEHARHVRRRAARRRPTRSPDRAGSSRRACCPRPRAR